MVQLVSFLSGLLIGITGSVGCVVLYFLIKSLPFRLNLKWLGSLPNIPLVLIWLFVPLYIFDHFKHDEAYLHSSYFYQGESWSLIGGAIGLALPFLILSFGIIRSLRISGKTSDGSKKEVL